MTDDIKQWLITIAVYLLVMGTIITALVLVDLQTIGK